MNDEHINKAVEDVTPNPEHLIKSISEQGYSFEAAIADLIDNSISADATQVEVLIDTETQPYTLFLADNGRGMDVVELQKSMKFPSNSPDEGRGNNDLGRFGLGMKTASFSQTRKFTTLSRTRGTTEFSGRTWDLEFLKSNGWNLIIESKDSITELVDNYITNSESRFNTFEGFNANTIVIWKGLYKFEQYLSEKSRKNSLLKEIEIIAEHLSLVFHRFMEKSNRKLELRINNQKLRPFNPFPMKEKGFRTLEFKKRNFGDDSIKIEGFVLPARSIKESRQGISAWTTKARSLMDMEGIYIYRADRLILFGGWNGLIKKAPRLQLARLQVEIGNNADHLLHLNVAKSQVIIPHELKSAFQNYINDLKSEAEREYYNRSIVQFKEHKNKNKMQLFERKMSSKGPLLEVNRDFELVQSLLNELDDRQTAKVNMLFAMINTRINKLRDTQIPKNFIDEQSLSELDINLTIRELLDKGIDKHTIRQYVLPELGFNPDSFPENILDQLKGN